MISLGYLFSFLFLWVHLAYAGVNPLLATRSLDSGITPDLQEMLKHPNASLPRSAHLATYVTQPFAQDPTQRMTFFSDPKKHYGDWNTLFQTYTEHRARKIIAFDVFSIMGISRRAILLDGNKAYKTISDAQKTGMLGIVQGKLGFKNKYLNDFEKEIVARELLHLGRSLTNRELRQNLDSFKRVYREAGRAPRERRHFQICALLMIAGYDRKGINDAEWYLEGVLDRDALLSRVYDYEDKLLPKFPRARVETGGDDDKVFAGAGTGSSDSRARDCLKKLITTAGEGKWGG